MAMVGSNSPLFMEQKTTPLHHAKFHIEPFSRDLFIHIQICSHSKGILAPPPFFSGGLNPSVGGFPSSADAGPWPVFGEASETLPGLVADSATRIQRNRGIRFFFKPSGKLT